MITLGTKVRDAITGFEGIATSRVEYINGCVQYSVLPQSKDGTMPQAEYIDYQRLEKIGDGVDLPSRDAGGSMRDTPSTNYRG